MYLVDNLLPDISGVELCRELRTFDLQTPIIFHSAVAYQSDIDSALASGAQEYLAKPVDINELLSTIERLIAS